MKVDQNVQRVGEYADLVLDSGRDGVSASNMGTSIAQYLGLTKIGAGRFSAVFEYPGDNTKVIKVGLAPEKDSAFDDPWLGYAAMVMMLPPSPYLPRIYSMQLFRSSYVVVMERLEVAMGDFRKPEDKRYKYHRQFIELWSNTLRRAVAGAWRWQDDVARLIERYPNEFDANGFAYYVKLFQTIGGFDDLHEENVMLRGKTLIITDPYWQWSSLNHKVNLKDYSVRINGSHVVDVERMSNGQNRVQPVYAPPSVRSRPEKEDVALWFNSVHAVPAHIDRVSRILSQVRYEPIAPGTNIVERLQQAA